MRHIFLMLTVLVLSFTQGCLDGSGIRPHSSPEVEDSLNKSSSLLNRFTIVGDNLCIVSNDVVKLYNIQTPNSPNHVGTIGWGQNILSIRSYKDSLLLIGDNNGLSLNKIATAFNFTSIGSFPSAQYYDPFTCLADTIFLLQTRALFNTNQYPDVLGIFNSKNLPIPILTYDKNLRFPSDISSDANNNLFICDSGLKVFNASNSLNINLIAHFKIDAKNIIAYNDTLYILGSFGLHQYKYSGNAINELSIIPIIPTP